MSKSYQYNGTNHRGCKQIFGHHLILMAWELSEKLVLRRFHGNQISVHVHGATSMRHALFRCRDRHVAMGLLRHPEQLMCHFLLFFN